MLYDRWIIFILPVVKSRNIYHKHNTDYHIINIICCYSSIFVEYVCINCNLALHKISSYIIKKFVIIYLSLIAEMLLVTRAYLIKV